MPAARPCPTLHRVVGHQENLDKLYKWEEENKMKFNGKKFQLLRYGTNDDLKNNTVYFTGHMEEVIEQFSSIRDLGGHNGR